MLNLNVITFLSKYESVSTEEKKYRLCCLCHFIYAKKE